MFPGFFRATGRAPLWRPYCSARTLTAGRRDGGPSPTALYGGMQEENFTSKVTLVGGEGELTFDAFAT